MFNTIVTAAVATLLILAYVPSTHAVSMHPSSVTAPQAYIDNGERFAATGFLRLMDEFGNNAGFGSFTLIHQHWGITAAHNFFDNLSVTGNTASSAAVGFGSAIDNTELVSVDAFFIHPDFTSIALSPDIALLRFDDPISSVAPAEIFEGVLEVRDTVTAVGYGTPADASGIFLPVDGIKRGATNEVTRIGDPGFGIPSDHVLTQFLPPNFTRANPLGGTATPGDSGGGLYFGDQLAGVVGFNISGFDYGSNTGSLLLSSQLSFINDVQSQHPPRPTPASGILFVLGVGSLAGLRGRKSLNAD